jgi:hypothetical protein
MPRCEGYSITRRERAAVVKRTLRDLGKSVAFDPKQTSTSAIAGLAL